jgi:hypothetical protein
MPSQAGDDCYLQNRRQAHLEGSSSDAAARPRPPLFRALGASDPPGEIQIDGHDFRLDRIIKHDSWAATALYAGPSGRVVCKFNRQQSIGFNRQQSIGIIPMRWLGYLLAHRERSFMERLANVPNAAKSSGDVFVAGSRQRHAVAHDFIAGHPLRRGELLGDDFFQALRQLLDGVHRHQMAHVDLHKRENIIVGDDRQPYLIDFQISFALPRWWPGNSWPMRLILQMLQGSDDYHYEKHVARNSTRPQPIANRPWWIRAHRAVAVPLRTARRNLLVMLGVRRGGGSVTTEHFVEEALREKAA